MTYRLSQRLVALVGLAAVVALAASGCARDCCLSNPFPPLTLAATGPAAKWAIDAEAVASYSATNELLTPPETESYHRLTAADVQCLAAAHAVVANLNALEAQLACRQCVSGPKRQRSAACLQHDLLVFRANQDRNRAAAEALTLYYQLVEAHFAMQSAEQAVALLDGMIGLAEQIRRGGFPLDVEPGELVRQRLNLLDQQAELRSTLTRLNEALGYLIGRPLYETTPFWPVEPLRVEAFVVDRDEAIAHALALRSEIGALQRVLAALDTSTASVAGEVIAQAGSTLPTGASSGRIALLGCLHAGDDACQLAARRLQLTELHGNTRRRVAGEVRQAAEAVEARLLQIAAASETVANWRQRLEQLEHRQAANQATSFDVRAARLQLLAAEREHLSRITAWKIAQVELAKAQGLLSLECGYRAPAGCGVGR